MEPLWLALMMNPAAFVLPTPDTILDFGLVILDYGSLAGCRFQLAICPTLYLK
jgi:hypothetical protein